MAGPTVLKLGYTDPRTDTFGGHPALGGPLDLNDGVTFTLVSPDGLELSAPTHTLVPTGNIRTQGERVVRALYRHNREALVRLVVGPATSYSAFAQNVRTLLAWVNSAPAQPVTLVWQPPSAAQPVYLDVVGGACDVSVDEGEWLRQTLEPVELVFIVRPGLRGDRVTLSNLATNPGFEQLGSVVGFNDALATLGAYTVQAGGALTQDTAQFADALLALQGAAGATATTVNLLRYYRLDETSGTTCYDASGQGQNGTTHGAPTQNVAGLLTGDVDPCYTFAAASSQYITCATTGLPVGNAPWWMGGWFKIAANPTASAVIAFMGTGTAKQFGELFVDPSGKLEANFGGTNIVSAAAVSLNTAHFAALTWDGTTLTLYLDGTSAGTATPGALNLTMGTAGFGAFTGGVSLYWNGQLDECVLGSGCPSSAQISTLWNAGHNAPASASNTLVIPSGGRVSFAGGQQWGSLINWQVRLRYTAGMTGTFYPHYTDANNNLQIVVNGTGITAQQMVGGVTHAVSGTAGTLAATLVPGLHYWLRSTLLTPPQTVAGEQCYLGAELRADANGSVGVSLGFAGGGTYDTVTAMSGPLEMSASGAGLSIGGNFAGVQQVNIPGPNGWSVVGSQNGATGTAWAGWEQTAGQTYPNGPVTSGAAARLDLPASGTIDCLWHLYAGGIAPAGTSAVPVASPGDTLAFSVAARSAGLGGSATLCVVVSEYDASGNPLRTSANLASKTGNQAAWTTLSGSYATGASCAWCDVALRVVDAVAGESANGQVWWDNLQVWNQTRTGQTSMPYSELRFMASPAQMVVSGLLGDLAAPCLLEWGTYQAAWGRGSALTYALGRRGVVSANAQLAAAAVGYYGSVFAPAGQPVVDPSAYGGYYVKAAVQNGSTWQPRGFSQQVKDSAGIYHLLIRFKTADPSPSAVQVRARTEEALDAWYVDTLGLGTLGAYWGPWSNPLGGNGWTVCDVGQVQLPPFPKGALADPTAIWVIPRGEWNAASGTPVEADANYLALLPVDGAVVLGVVNNPSNSPIAQVTNSYIWVYVDGLLANRAGAQVGGPGVGMGLDGPSAGYSVETTAVPNPAHAGGGSGTQGTGAINVNGGGDPYLTLDPTQQIAGVGQAGSGGVNQLVGYVTDSAGDVLPLAVEIAYSPLYLWPR